MKPRHSYSELPPQPECVDHNGQQKGQRDGELHRNDERCNARPDEDQGMNQDERAQASERPDNNMQAGNSKDQRSHCTPCRGRVRWQRVQRAILHVVGRDVSIPCVPTEEMTEVVRPPTAPSKFPP